MTDASSYYPVVAARYLEVIRESRQLFFGPGKFTARHAAEQALTGDPESLAQYIVNQAAQVKPQVTPEVEEIAARLRGVAHIPITDATSGSKHYGYKLNVGDSELGSLWHCTDNRTHPDEEALIAEGGDLADLYCDSHYPTVDDNRALDFLLNARHDIQRLLALLGIEVALEDADE